MTRSIASMYERIVKEALLMKGFWTIEEHWWPDHDPYHCVDHEYSMYISLRPGVPKLCGGRWRKLRYTLHKRGLMHHCPQHCQLLTPIKWKKPSAHAAGADPFRCKIHSFCKFDVTFYLLMWFWCPWRFRMFLTYTRETIFLLEEQSWTVWSWRGGKAMIGIGWDS